MAMAEMAWALRLTGVSPACKLVAIIVGDSCSPENNSTLTLARICEFACTDEASARAAIEELYVGAGITWDEVKPGIFEFRLPFEAEEVVDTPRRPDTSPLALYVMSCGNRTKIGIARNASSRRLSLQPFNANTVILEWSHIGPAHLIRRAERAAHKALTPTRIHSEWYSISVADAIEAAKRHLRDAGVAVS